LEDDTRSDHLRLSVIVFYGNGYFLLRGWLSSLSFLLGFGSIIAGILTRKGIHFAIIFFNYHVGIGDDGIGESVWLLPAIIGIVLTAIMSRRHFLELSPSVDLLISQSNRIFLLRVVLIPAMLGVAIILVSHLPEIRYHDIVLGSTIILPLVISVISSNSVRALFVKRYEADSAFQLWLIAGIAAVILARLVFSSGLNFMI
jgi:hypothetical protein